MSGNNIVYVAPDEKSKIYRKLKTASLHGVHLSKAFISAAAQGVCLLLALACFIYSAYAIVDYFTYFTFTAN